MIWTTSRKGEIKHREHESTEIHRESISFSVFLGVFLYWLMLQCGFVEFSSYCFYLAALRIR